MLSACLEDGKIDFEVVYGLCLNVFIIFSMNQVLNKIQYKFFIQCKNYLKLL